MVCHTLPPHRQSVPNPLRTSRFATGARGSSTDGPLSACSMSNSTSSLFEVRAADVFHVEEHVFVGIVGVDETVATRIVEEVYGACRHGTAA